MKRILLNIPFSVLLILLLSVCGYTYLMHRWHRLSDKLYAQAIELYEASDYRSAIESFKDVLSLEEKIYPINESFVFNANLWIASCYHLLGDDDMASSYYKYFTAPPYRRELTIVSDKLADEASKLFQNGQYDEAIPLLLHVKEIEDSVFHYVTPIKANTLVGLIACYSKIQDIESILSLSEDLAKTFYEYPLYAEDHMYSLKECISEAGQKWGDIHDSIYCEQWYDSCLKIFNSFLSYPLYSGYDYVYSELLTEYITNLFYSKYDFNDEILQDKNLTDITLEACEKLDSLKSCVPEYNLITASIDLYLCHFSPLSLDEKICLLHQTFDTLLAHADFSNDMDRTLFSRVLGKKVALFSEFGQERYFESLYQSFLQSSIDQIVEMDFLFQSLCFFNEDQQLDLLSDLFDDTEDVDPKLHAQVADRYITALLKIKDFQTAIDKFEKTDFSSLPIMQRVFLFDNVLDCYEELGFKRKYSKLHKRIYSELLSYLINPSPFSFGSRNESLYGNILNIFVQYVNIESDENVEELNNLINFIEDFCDTNGVCIYESSLYSKLSDYYLKNGKLLESAEILEKALKANKRSNLKQENSYGLILIQLANIYSLFEPELGLQLRKEALPEMIQDIVKMQKIVASLVGENAANIQMALDTKMEATWFALQSTIDNVEDFVYSYHIDSIMEYELYAEFYKYANDFFVCFPEFIITHQEEYLQFKTKESLRLSNSNSITYLDSLCQFVLDNKLVDYFLFSFLLDNKCDKIVPYLKSCIEDPSYEISGEKRPPISQLKKLLANYYQDHLYYMEVVDEVVSTYQAEDDKESLCLAVLQILLPFYSTDFLTDEEKCYIRNELLNIYYDNEKYILSLSEKDIYDLNLMSISVDNIMSEIEHLHVASLFDYLKKEDYPKATSIFNHVLDGLYSDALSNWSFLSIASDYEIGSIGCLLLEKNAEDIDVSKLYNYLLFAKNASFTVEQKLAHYLETTDNEYIKHKYERTKEMEDKIINHQPIYLYNHKVDLNLAKQMVLCNNDELRDLATSHVQIDDLESSNWRKIQKHLNRGETCVDVFMYTDAFEKNPRYGAFVFSSKGGIEYVPLCADADLISHYSTDVVSPFFWAPLSSYITLSSKIYLSPDANLHNYSVEYSIDKEVHRVTSLKILLAEKKKDAFMTASLFGGLIFGDSLTQTNEPTKNRYTLSYLPASSEEVDNISQILDSNGIVAHCYKGATGKEEVFRNTTCSNSDILHVATHGYFRDSTYDYSSSLNVFSYKDEMLDHVGLLFSYDDTSNLKKDGILSAAEISRLNFSNVDLVVLSACVSALGISRSGDVFNLPRAFKKAGASTILASLRDIDDQATKIFMTAFYSHLMSSQNTYHSLKYAQNVLKNYSVERSYVGLSLSDIASKNVSKIEPRLYYPYSDPYYWTSFILIDSK